MLSVYLFLPPAYTFPIIGVTEAVAVTIFLVVCVTISLVCEALHVARRRADLQRQQMEQQIRERQEAEERAMLLRMSGHETRVAHDGLEAVEAAERFRPDVVLLDIGLPKLNGYDACRRIREQPWGQKMLLVALSGWGQDEDRQKSRQAGFDQHLVKPADYGKLMKLLAECEGTARGTAVSCTLVGQTSANDATMEQI